MELEVQPARPLLSRKRLEEPGGTLERGPAQQDAHNDTQRCPTQPLQHPTRLLQRHASMLTYSEYFQATASPFGSTPAERNEAYRTIYGYFTPGSTPQQLLEQLLNLFEAQAVGALGIFVADIVGESRLQLVHGLRKYPDPLAQHSPNMDKAFGYLDDIQGEVGELVQVNSDMLSKTTASWVLSFVHHIAELDNHRQRPYIPLVQEGATHAKMISAHKAFFIPFELVLFLLGKGLSPGRPWGSLAGTVLTVPAGDPTLLQPGSPFHQLHEEQGAIPGPTQLSGLVTSYQQGLRWLKIQQMPLQRAIADEMGELITPAIVLEEQLESAFTIPSPDFGDGFHTFRMTQNINWLPNVYNVVALRLLPRPDPPQAPINAGSNGNNYNSNNHSSSPGVCSSSRTPLAQTRLQSSHVKKLEASKMRETIQAMRDKGKGPLSRSDGKERCHSWHIKGVCFSSCKHMYDHVAITSSEQDQLWQWYQEAYA
eukprot:jgi/Psemu1/23245/gm1.23245_g